MENESYATTKVLSSGLRKLSFRACLTLLGRCIGAIYAMIDELVDGFQLHR